MSLQTEHLTQNLYFTFGRTNKVYTKPKEAEPNEKIDFQKLIELVCYPKNNIKRNIQQIRKICFEGFENGIDKNVIKQQIKPFKYSLPFVLFSGWCPVHHNDNDINYIGAIQIDIDFKFIGGNEKANEVKEQLSKIPYISFAVISCTGYGVKALILTTNKNIKQHNKVSKGLILDLSERLGIDKKYFDNLGASQPCFITLDEKPFINNHYTTFDHEKAILKLQVESLKSKKAALQKQNKLLSEANKRPVTPINSETPTVPKIEVLKFLTSEIVKAGINITDGYNDWFSVACAYGSTGALSQPLFHDVAKLHPQYDYDENSKKFKEGLKHGNEHSFRGFLNRCKTALNDDNLISNFYKDWIKNWYENNSPKLGRLTTRTAHHSDGSQKYGWEYHTTLKVDQFIKDRAKLSLQNGFHLLIGGTGYGKSSFFRQLPNDTKLLVLTFNTASCIGWKSKGFFHVNEKGRDQLEREVIANKIFNSNKIVCTYASFFYVLSILEYQNELKNWLIVHDEYHQLYESFREVERNFNYIDFTLKRLSKNNAICNVSANEVSTPDIEYITEQRFFKLGISKKARCYYNANEVLLFEKISKALNEGRKVLLFTNTKDEAKLSQKIKEAFTGYEIDFYNSTNSHDEKVNERLTNLVADITICTSSLQVGKDVNHQKAACIIYIDKDNSYKIFRSLIPQFSGRGRILEGKKFDWTFDYLFSFKDNKNINYWNEENDRDHLENAAKYYADGFNIYESKATKENRKMHHYNELIFIDETEKAHVNHRMINQRIEKLKSEATLKNSDNFIQFMAKHHYKVELCSCEIENKEDEKLEIEKSKRDQLHEEIQEIEKGNINDLEETTAKKRFEAMKKVYDKKTITDLMKKYDSEMKYKQLIALTFQQKGLENKKDAKTTDIYKDILKKTANYTTSTNIIEDIASIKVDGRVKGALTYIINQCKEAIETKVSKDGSVFRHVDNVKVRRRILKDLSLMFVIDYDKKSKKHRLKKPNFALKKGVKIKDIKALKSQITLNYTTIYKKPVIIEKTALVV